MRHGLGVVLRHDWFEMIATAFGVVIGAGAVFQSAGRLDGGSLAVVGSGIGNDGVVATGSVGIAGGSSMAPVNTRVLGDGHVVRGLVDGVVGGVEWHGGFYIKYCVYCWCFDSLLL